MASDCKIEVKKKIASREIPNYEMDKDRSWTDIPTELLELIMSHLFLQDCTRFRLTCKSWMSIRPPLRSHHLLFPSHCGSQHLPWLIAFLKNNSKGTCKFYNPVYGDSYVIDIPELAGANVRSAKYGWLLVSRGRSNIFFFNPFSMETIQLPDFEEDINLSCISFSSPPTSTDFIVFARCSFMMFVYYQGEERWKLYSLGDNVVPKEFVAPCNPVFSDGIFYFLSEDGKLGVLKPNEVDEDARWRILPVSPVFSYSTFEDFAQSRSSYLVEYDSEIFSIFVSHQGKKIWVFKYDRSKEEWNVVENLADKVLFLSHTASILVPVGLKGIQNRIYFPRFHLKDNVSNDVVFYSLSTSSYHCFGNECSRGDWTNTCELWHCAWVQSSEH
ncbi:hypothetical protein ACHQM5_003672 [Ranunculus cassubicifolius]